MDALTGLWLLVTLVPPAVVVRIMLRPRLSIAAKVGKGAEGEYRELVRVRYAQVRTAFPSASSAFLIRPPTAAPESGEIQAKECSGLYIRASVCNWGWVAARECRVFVKRILLDRKEIEHTPSQLAWKGRDTIGERFAPQTLMRSHKVFVDICAADEFVPQLQVKSLRATEGYAPYSDAGLYAFEISAESEGSWLCSPAFLQLEIRHDGRKWDELEVVRARERPWWKKLW